MTILTAPGNESSVNNEMIFVLQDAKAADPVTYPNYKYVLDIYVDGELKGRLRSTPDPTYSFGKFDVSVILRDYVPAYGLKANYANLTEEYDINVAYTCKIGEEYDDILTTNILVDSERTAYKTYAPRPFMNSDILTPKFGASPCALSNIPQHQKSHLTGYKSDKWFIVPFFSVGTSDIVRFSFDDGNGNIIGTIGGISINVSGMVVQANMSFEKLSDLVGLTNNQKEQVKRILFDTETTEAYIVNYACSKYTPVNIAWLNPYGAYESQSFGLVSKKQNQISRKEFAQLPYDINASGVVSYDQDGVMRGSKKGYAATVEVSLAVTSHLLTDDEYTWLADLFNSPDVYFFSTVLDRWVPCSIGDTNYEYRTFKNSRLTPLKFTINFTDKYNAQYL